MDYVPYSIRIRRKEVCLTMSQPQNPIEYIARQVETKSAVKQQTYRNLKEVFGKLHDEARKVVDEVRDDVTGQDRDVTMEVTSISDNEFQLKIAGDLLVFLMHTNIVTQAPEHGFNKTPYVQENPMRKYLGQINVYNFMSDSLKYNRLNDPGYLIARLFINVEKHFLVEGDGQLSFMFEHVSGQPISDTDISIFIQLAITQSIDNDLVTPPFPTIRQISLIQKMERAVNMGMGNKIGFQMSYDRGKPE